MRYFLILFFISNALCQSDFLKPSDFNDNPPKFPTVNLPSFSSQDEIEDISLTDEINLIKGDIEFKLLFRKTNRNYKILRLKLKNQLMSKFTLFLNYQIIN